MGAVRQRRTRPDAVTLDAAVAAFLETFTRPEQAATRRTYTEILTFLLRDPFNPREGVGALDTPELAESLRRQFTQRWATAAGSTWNRNLAALRSACAYWRTQHWITTDPLAGLERAKTGENRARARPRASIKHLLARKSISVRERTLWSMLYESGARAGEVLALDVEDLDRANRRARVRRKGGAPDEITWQTRTARLLAHHLGRRTRGPLFLTARTARVELAPADLDPATGRARLSYRRVAELFTELTGGWTLHDLRHSALTHAAEDGMPTPMLMTKSGHACIRTLGRYARPSVDSLARWHDQRDPTSRNNSNR
jgi:integrase/recombinase XerC/integrase/recombinase XerD